MRETLKEFWLTHGREELLAQWHDSKNGDLTPADVSFGSQKKIWWQCSKGHEWRVLVKPTLKAVAPDKNEPLKVTKVMPGSTRRVWWRCIDGHEWKAVVYSRTGAQKCGCPVCAERYKRER